MHIQKIMTMFLRECSYNTQYRHLGLIFNSHEVIETASLQLCFWHSCDNFWIQLILAIHHKSKKRIECIPNIYRLPHCHCVHCWKGAGIWVQMQRFQIFIVDCWKWMVMDTLVGVFLISRMSRNKSALLDINPARFDHCCVHKENSLKS